MPLNVICFLVQSRITWNFSFLFPVIAIAHSQSEIPQV